MFDCFYIIYSVVLGTNWLNFMGGIKEEAQRAKGLGFKLGSTASPSLKPVAMEITSIIIHLRRLLIREDFGKTLRGYSRVET